MPDTIPRLKLLLRKDEELVCLWQLAEHDAALLDTLRPPDLNVEMTKAIHCIPPDCLRADAVFLCNRAARFWMEVQGMRDRNFLLMGKDASGIPQDYFEGVRVAIEKGI